MASAPLLLLDNDSLLALLSDGTFKCQTISFEEAKAIIDMHDTKDIIRSFSNPDIEKIIYEYLGMQKRAYAYKEPSRMLPEQDGIVFRLYVTESETRPVIKTPFGNEAKKIQNIYVYCELISRLE